MNKMDCANDNIKVEVIQEKNRWIKIEDKLPLAFSSVLITDGKYVGMGYLVYDEHHIKYWKTHSNLDCVRYWQQPPEPPKDEI
jgi:hypothetical protein